MVYVRLKSSRFTITDRSTRMVYTGYENAAFTSTELCGVWSISALLSGISFLAETIDPASNDI